MEPIKCNVVMSWLDTESWGVTSVFFTIQPRLYSFNCMTRWNTMHCLFLAFLLVSTPPLANLLSMQISMQPEPWVRRWRMRWPCLRPITKGFQRRWRHAKWWQGCCMTTSLTRKTSLLRLRKPWRWVAFTYHPTVSPYFALVVLINETLPCGSEQLTIFSTGAPTKTYQGQKGSGWAQGTSTEPARHLKATKHSHGKPGPPALCWWPLHVTPSSPSSLLTSGPVTDSWFCEYCDSQLAFGISIHAAREAEKVTHTYSLDLKVCRTTRGDRESHLDPALERVRGRKGLFNIMIMLIKAMEDPMCV